MSELNNPSKSTRPISQPTEDLRLPPVGRHFYSREVQRLLPALGSHEHNTYDYHAALEELNESTRLGMTPLELKSFALMYTALAQSSRFRQNPYLEARLGENSAVHSIHCALLMVDQFDAAGLLSEDKQSREIIDLRLQMTRGSLVHDMGEVLGEFTSLSQRMADISLHEIPKIERRILQTTMRLALWSAQESKPLDFYQHMSELRSALKIGAPGQASLKQVERALGHFDELVLSSKPLSAESSRCLEAALALFDKIELKDERELSERDRFISCGVKIVEHLQGTRHFLRFATKDSSFSPLREFSTPTQPTRRAEEAFGPAAPATLPIGLSPSYIVRRSAEFIESGLTELMQSAKSAEEIALAKRIRNSCWETSIECLNASCRVFDRDAAELPPRLMETMTRVWSGELGSDKQAEHLASARAMLRLDQIALLGRHHRLAAQIGPDEIARTLLPVETGERLMSLYRTAIDRDYVPPPGSPPLALLKALPDELSPITLVNWRERRQNRA